MTASRREAPVALTLRTRPIERTLVVVPVLLVVAGLVAQTIDLALDGALFRTSLGRLDLQGEQSLPAAWSASLFLAAAALMLLEARLARLAGGADWRWWTALAVLAAAAAADELLAIHERTIDPLRRWLDVGGPFTFAWVIPGMIGLAVLCLAFSGFVRRLPRPVRRGLVTGTALLAAGAIGIEMLGAWWASVQGSELVFRLLYSAEEALEFAGATVIVITLLRPFAGTRLVVARTVTQR